MTEIFENIKNLNESQCKNLQRAAARLGYQIECVSDVKKEEPMNKITCSPNCKDIKKIVSNFGYNIECQ